MHRARSRDQHFVAGIGCIALERCLSIGDPTGRSIARGYDDFPSVSPRITASHGSRTGAPLKSFRSIMGINVQSASKSPGGFNKANGRMTKLSLANWLLGRSKTPQGRARRSRTSPPMVERHVPDGRGLLFHAGLPAGNRVPRCRRAFSVCHARARAGYPVCGPSALQARGAGQPQRAGQYRHAGTAVSRVGRQDFRSGIARIRDHGFRHHHDAVGSGCGGALRSQSLRSALACQPDGR